MKTLVKIVIYLILWTSFTQVQAQDIWPTGGSDTASAIDVFAFPNGSNLHFCYHSSDVIYLKGGTTVNASSWVLFNTFPTSYILAYDPQSESFTWGITCIKEDGIQTVIHPKFHSAPAVTTQPQDQTRLIGESASFSITAGVSVPQTIPCPQGDTYRWQKNNVDILGQTSSTLDINNLILSDAGEYRCIVSNVCGSDTSDAATLTVSCNAITHSQTFVECQGFSITVGTHTYNSTGIYTDILLASNGCDSTVTTNLTVNQATASTQTISACDNYSWYGSTYTNSGIHTHVIPNSNGCDSTITLDLTIKNSTLKTINQTSCNSYILNGTTYNASGTFTQTLINAVGCDSVITLNLIVKNSTSKTINQTSCNSYILNGTSYNATGTYTQTLTNAAGCDSVITLNLIINFPPSQISLGNDTAVCNNYLLNAGNCTDCQYQWQNGNSSHTFSVTTSGQYWVHVTNSCGTVADTANIIIKGTTPFVNAINDTIICSGNSVLLSASGNGNFVWSTGDSVSSITVVPMQNTNYTVYAYNDCGIDSAKILVSITQQANAGTDSSVNVCSNYTPVVNLTDFLSANHQSGGTWIDTDVTGALYGTNFVTGLVTTNNYYHFTYVVNGNSPCPNDSAKITLYVQICSGIEGNNLNQIAIYPNPVNDKLTIETMSNSTVEIINSQGQIIKNLELINSKNNIDLKKLIGGVYTIKIKNDDGIIVKKLIKQ
ncbi:MAG: hypothetical protein A2275_07285 [Bacteroidetes bacterium RIFOXYA12_FULL_35_11]|nr:MAG: hypothetical protein A2275_07285 [Bacteroidetes bacterium RIFOXYA12_FULL_35_11]HBX53787.1 hypothetical protein [Bacteroidales bacterium]